MSEQSETAETDHPHTDPGDGRERCPGCGKWVWQVIHSCTRVLITSPGSEPS